MKPLACLPGVVKVYTLEDEYRWNSIVSKELDLFWSVERWIVDMLFSCMKVFATSFSVSNHIFVHEDLL